MGEQSKIYLGADHRGFALKETIRAALELEGYEVVDCGNTIYDPEDDFPDYALAVAQAVSKEVDGKGVVFCGSGVGVSIAANKVKGIRAAAEDLVMAVQEARQHNNINVLAVAADRVTETQVREMVDAFLQTPFAGKERFNRRLQKITDYEENN
jgi:ribose 5-phosphate isomerase B